MTVPKGHAVASASFTRPADTTAYASGDLVANSTTAGSVVAMTLSVGTAAGMPARIRRVRLMGDKADATNFNFRVHLFSVLGDHLCQRRQRRVLGQQGRELSRPGRYCDGPVVHGRRDGNRDVRHHQPRRHCLCADRGPCRLYPGIG
jgi:hypothetical protein